MTPAKPPLLVLAGPTASGKTEVALCLSRRLRCEMISCDSMQVYRRIPILTQAPSAKVRKSLKTHLVSFLDPSREYSAALFRRDAEALIGKILKKKKIPLIVGGTGLYLRALLDGLFEGPDKTPFKDEAYRRRLVEEQAAHGGDFLHRKLREADPASAAKIHPNDVRRLVRALEVFHLTGRPMSVEKPNRRGVRDKFDVRIFVLDLDREELYRRINARVDRMVRQGLLKEVERLLKKKVGQTAAGALGIRQMKAHLEGTMSFDKAVELLKRDTRNYAKRQLSWFRHEKGVEPVPVDRRDTPEKTAVEILKRWNGAVE